MANRDAAAAAGDPPPRKREVFSTDNISIAAALGNLGWSAATIMAKLPELALLGGGLTLGGVGVWQSIKTKLNKKKKEDTDD